MTLAEDIECFWLSSPNEPSASNSANDSQALADALDVATSIDTRPAKYGFQMTYLCWSLCL